jgi:hypothetical protein
MVELLIDLIAARLSYSPVPVQLLETLAILFDHDSVFQRKHKSKTYDRLFHEKQLGERILANSPSSSTFAVYNRNEPYGWLCQIINRFVFKDGIQHLKEQFKSEQPLTATVRKICVLYSIQWIIYRNTMRYFYLLSIVWIILS